MLITDIMRLTLKKAKVCAEKSGAKTKILISSILTNIDKRDHRLLIRILKEEDGLSTIEDAFIEHSNTHPNKLVKILERKPCTLPLSSIVAYVYILGCVNACEPMRLKFTPRLDAVEINHELWNDDGIWLKEQIDALTDTKTVLTVSQWAEEKRYLPPQVTPLPGFYSYNVAPYLREIADCLSVDSPVREIDFMKAAQVGATVGILENCIGYLIDHVKVAPSMLLTADGELAQLRMESYITPMLQYSDLNHLIQSSDSLNSRKTGKTDKKLEWAGGGFLVPYGARNADKLRSLSIQFLLEDECDTFPPGTQKLVEVRTKAYHETRKIIRMSTPLLVGSSHISAGYERGDKRKFFVPCKGCKKMQELTFRSKSRNESEKPYGLQWSTFEDGGLDPESVVYVCKYCDFKHANSDKSWMLPRGEWRASAKSRDPAHRSYHISALYSPVGMYPWDAIVRDWLDAWDTENNIVRSVELMQEFSNTNLGIPYEATGSKIRFSNVSAHRRVAYKFGEVPNNYATLYAGSPILFLSCSVDVHKLNLAVAVFGWTADARCFVIDYWRFNIIESKEQDCRELSSPAWGKLRELIEEKRYLADDGKEYGIAVTLIDAGYSNDTVTTFCSDYATGVYPILGRDRAAKNQTIKEFSEFTTKIGTIGYRILVDHYKDRLGPVLRRTWQEEQGDQKRYHFNAPVDMTDKQLRELTVENRRIKIHPNGFKTYFWYRPGNARNELWDLLVYAHASVEILAWNICIKHFELETVDWSRFWQYVENEGMYFIQK